MHLVQGLCGGSPGTRPVQRLHQRVHGLALNPVFISEYMDLSPIRPLYMDWSKSQSFSASTSTALNPIFISTSTALNLIFI
jgi:hypothetical protein